MLDVENNQFIHPEQLYKFLKNSESAERQTIILVDFDDISVAELFKYISNFNIIILTNNAFDLVKSPEEVPLINFIDKNYKTLEFIETQEIFRYFVEEYFQKDFDIIDVEHIFNKEFMENMKISIFLK
ncbi:Uncharacterised protein [Mycoplasmopsis edwardii]|uniref:Uncharacterized protein n=3 Tax=Mycoplasmopsis edwardii TaxID=53558 RepID=A0A3B0Q8W8_9BACT|nr:Uncharacterised protein [Mycoplasmopsis edwardii]